LNIIIKEENQYGILKIIDLTKEVMILYRVLMFGTGNYSNIVENILRDNVLILAYVDNDTSKWNSKKNGKIIISSELIDQYEFDYIIIGSQFNEEIYMQLSSMNIDKNKIFQYSKFTESYWNYYNAAINLFVSDEDIFYNVLVTGISYAALGFREDICIKEVLNFSFASQDIFYDYHTIKYLSENYKCKISKVKHIIIGLSCYSFQYDMSKSAMKGKAVLYYEVLNNSHHFQDIDRIYEEYDINKKIANKLIRKNENGNYDFSLITAPDFKNLEDKNAIGKKQAEMDCNKNYPETVKENTEIFKDYLKLLKDNNIKPIVVVFPASRYYTMHFSRRIEDEFNKIITEMKKEYDFQFVDYFRSDLFYDDDFHDVSHLNRKGAEKFTKILNEIIEW